MKIRNVLLLLLPFVLLISCEKKEDDVIKIGAVLPLSGDNAKYGNWIREGLELYRDKLNSSGGVNNARLEIIYEDDKTEPKVAVSAMNELINVYKVPIVYGSWSSSCVLAQAPIAETNNVILMAQAISPKIRDAGDYIFRGIPSAEYSISTLAPYVYGIGIRKVAILYINNDYGIDQANLFADKFKELGGNIIASEGYNSGQNNFYSVLIKIKDLHPDGIYLPGYTEVAYILKQAKELGIKSHFFSSDPFENQDIIDIAKNSADGVVYPFYYLPGRGNEQLRFFEESYKKKYGVPPEGTAALAYNALDVIVYALKIVDSNTDTKKIKEAIYNISDYNGILGKTSFDLFGDIKMNIYLKTVVNSKFVPVN